MKKILVPLFASALIGCVFVSGCSRCEKSSKGSLKQVTFEQVKLEDDFWLPRLKTQKQTLVPFALEKTEPAVENLRRTGAYLKGEKTEPLLEWPIFVSSDLYKVMEGAAYLLAVEPDSLLERQMDKIIDVIADAQKEDGYLYTHHIMPPELRHQPNNNAAGPRPYSWVVHSHELYNMGHMYEGALAYYKATGKRKWLDVAEKSARHINRAFFIGDSAYNEGKPINQAPGHQEIEMALIKLYRETGDSLYFNMAQKFLDIRGVTYRPDGEGGMSPEYAQQACPVKDIREAYGHAVRAVYLYSGMADIVAETGDKTYLPALEAVWHDIVDRKMHITGGLGSVPGIEGFGPAYELPNKNTYDETCSGVGSVMFNYRMFLMSRDAKYVDVAEVALYNNVLAGVNLEGNKFFYVNPLEADGKQAFNHGRAGRSPWFGCACCPSNMARLIPQVPGMLYSKSGNDVYCGLYAGSNVDLDLNNGKVGLKQTTQYPFSGIIEFEVTPEVEDTEFTLWLRIPTWSNGGKFVAGDLYAYADDIESEVRIEVNGESLDLCVENGYAPISRKWNVGDKVLLDLSMPVRYSVADPRVEADINKVCITRGPLVYCAEEIDNAHRVTDYVIKDLTQQGEVNTIETGVLAGIPSITLDASVVTVDSVISASLTLIPYYAWNNRGDKAMNTWMARDADTARKNMWVMSRNIDDVEASFTCTTDDIYAVVDGHCPSNSHDTSISRWTSWPQLGVEQTVELKLKKSQPIESVSVYWYDDKGGVQLPKAWHMQYHFDGKWNNFIPYVTDGYRMIPDQFNMVHPSQPIEADAIRLIVTPRKDASVGILEVEVK